MDAPRRADAAHARRPDHGGDRARLPRPRADDGPAPGARQAQDRRAPASPTRCPSTPRCPTAWTACSPWCTSSSTRATPRAPASALVRAELCTEAIRLGRLLARLMPDDAETAGLLALMLLHDARREARVGGDGSSSRSPTRTARAGTPTRWRRAASASTARCACAGRPLPAAGGDRRPALRGGDARGDRLAADRGALPAARCMAPSPWSRSTARSRSAWPAARTPALRRRCERVDLDRYQPFHVAHAELLRRSGDDEGADRAFARAIELSANAVERAELERRRGSLRTSDRRR